MDNDKVKENMRVKITQLTAQRIPFIGKDNVDCREVGVTGIVCGSVAMNGWFWWVRHDNGEVGVYSFDEFEEIPNMAAVTVHAPIKANHNL